MQSSKGAECSLEQAISLQDLTAGGPGSGWFREKGHVSHSPGHTVVQITDVKGKKMPDVLQRAGWQNDPRFPNAQTLFVHKDLPGHIIEIGNNKWAHENEKGTQVAKGVGKVKGEAKRQLANHLNRILKGRDPLARPQANKPAPVPRPQAVKPVVAPKVFVAQPPVPGFARPAGAQPLPAPAPTNPKEKEMVTGKAVSITPLKPGEHANGAYIVVIDNGVKGVFKPANEENRMLSPHLGFQMQREAAAFQVAKIVGATDLVPTTMIRNIDGVVAPQGGGAMGKKISGQGSFQEFRVGADAIAISPADRYDGAQDTHRAAVFDYIIGNGDRHEGNWRMNNGQIILIDHGLLLKERDRHGYLKEGFIDKVGDTAINKAEVKKYSDNIDKISKSLKDLGISDKSIDGLKVRLGHLSNEKTWGDVKKLLINR